MECLLDAFGTVFTAEECPAKSKLRTLAHEGVADARMAYGGNPV
jgi:hypothetical protein